MKRLSAIKKPACIAMALMILTCGCAAAWGHYTSVQTDSLSLNIDAKNINLTVTILNTTYPDPPIPYGYFRYIQDPEIFSFDVIVDGQLVADDVAEYNGALPIGVPYEITDLKGNGSMIYHNEMGGKALSGTTTDAAIGYYLNLRDQNAYFVDVNTSLCTFDVYIDDVIACQNKNDFWFSLVQGSTYKVTNIKPISGYTYNGPAEFTGVVGTQFINVNIGPEYFTEE